MESFSFLSGSLILHIQNDRLQYRKNIDRLSIMRIIVRFRSPASRPVDLIVGCSSSSHPGFKGAKDETKQSLKYNATDPLITPDKRIKMIVF